MVVQGERPDNTRPDIDAARARLDEQQPQLRYRFRLLDAEDTAENLSLSLALGDPAALVLGIAPATAVFTIVSTILYRDLPFADPDRIVEIASSLGGSARPNGGVSYLDLQDWRAEARSFDGLGAAIEVTMNLADDLASPERSSGAFVSANAFDLIGERPILGRGFMAADDRPGAGPVVMLGERIWRERFGADATAIGRTIRVNGVPSTIVGVMRTRTSAPRSTARSFRAVGLTGAEAIPGPAGLSTSSQSPPTMSAASAVARSGRPSPHSATSAAPSRSASESAPAPPLSTPTPPCS